MEKILDDLEGMTVEENKVGDYECPIFVLSKAEEKRIHRPWTRRAVTKLLERWIEINVGEERSYQYNIPKQLLLFCGIFAGRR